MTASEIERITAVEKDNQHNIELLKEIRSDLKRLPGRISRRTKKQLTECRAIQDAKRLTKIDIKPDQDDFAWLKKMLVVLFAIGSVIGGAVYQFKESTVKTVSMQQIQGGGK